MCYSQDCEDKFIVLENKKFDLSSIKGQPLKLTSSNIDYEFSVCSNIKNQCGFDKCTFSYAGCKSENTYDEYCLGKQSSSIDKFELINNGKGIAIIHGDGDTYYDGCWMSKDRSIRIEILCDKSVSGIPTNIELLEPTCEPLKEYYTFRFSHKAGCPSGSSGLSAGSIMLIIIFVSLAVYIIAGIVINAAIRKKTGIEMIPNISFWMGFPSLIKDGFFFLIRRRPSDSYEAVE